MEEKEEMNKDVDGNKSSKRVWSGRILAIGLITFGVDFIVGISASLIHAFKSTEPYVYNFPQSRWEYLVGAGMLGMGFVLSERFFKK